jgi:hypothetical protein
MDYKPPARGDLKGAVLEEIETVDNGETLLLTFDVGVMAIYGIAYDQNDNELYGQIDFELRTRQHPSVTSFKSWYSKNKPTQWRI